MNTCGNIKPVAIESQPCATAPFKDSAGTETSYLFYCKYITLPQPIQA